MIDTIQNDYLEIKVNSLGAMLTSVKTLNNDIQYLWQGNKEFWASQATILFPIVGALQNNKYDLDGKTYEMASHGFARNSDFELYLSDKNKLVYRLCSDSSTLKQYPYEFELFIAYELKENNIIQSFKVNNRNPGEMLFSLGGHPGFNCPLHENESIEDYSIVFENNETLDSRLKEGTVLSGKTRSFLNNEREFRLSHSMFHSGAIILEGYKSKWVEIVCSKNKHVIRVTFDNFPYLGIWSSKNNGPFVCIEPWYGIDSTIGDSTDFREKEGLIKLLSGESFECSFSINIKDLV